MEEDRHYQIPHHVTEIILESISDGVFTVDHEWRITSFNRAAEVITGIPREQATGKYCWEIFRSNMCERDCALRRTMKHGKSFIDTSTYIVTKEGRRIPVVVSTSLLKDAVGKGAGLLVIAGEQVTGANLGAMFDDGGGGPLPIELAAPIDLPADAVPLARSELCENQAFRFGRGVYALQFHIEVTAEMIDAWLDEPGNRHELAGLDYVDPQAIRAETARHLPPMRGLADRVFGQFAALCGERR